MCGIAGWYARSRLVQRETIAAQCRAILHRGPDDEGLLIDGTFGFGMRRLSIIDQAGGHQPIETADGALAIVFNGEIYNYRELRADLARAGHVFRTAGDTETILAGFREWGNAVWTKLDGMFAVAIWDRARRRLTLARDPLGIKPLYVTAQNGGLAFASELKALLLLPDHRFDLDERAVHDFFSFGHIRSSRSIYRQVSTLEPGHFIEVDADRPPVVRRYWQARYTQAPVRSEREWIEEFRSRWLDTVERHLLSDVEVGAFLSGGIDSSAVVAAMAKVSGAPVRTFAIGFPIERYDESHHAEAVAKHLGCLHTSRIVDLAAARDLLPQLQRSYDEPFADASAIPTWYCSQLAREHVKVVLSGDGGDELFMGYKRHLTEAWIGSLPHPVRQAAQGILAFPATPVPALNHTIQRWQKAIGTAGLPDGAARFFAKTQITSQAMRRRVLSPHYRMLFDAVDCHERLRDEYLPDPATSISPDTVDQLAYGDLTINLPNAMLKKLDRASMAHSLEARVPFLSPAMVDWAMSVPRELKISNGVGKHIVREAIRPWMPDGIVGRRKQGFQIPLTEWFAGDFGRHAEELWNDAGMKGLGVLDPAAVDTVFSEHRRGARDHGRFLFALSMFSVWNSQRSPAPQNPVSIPIRIASAPAVGSTDRVPVTVAANDDAPASAPERTGSRRRVSAAAALLLAGWLMHDLAGPLAPPASAATFVDEAVRSHQATLIRAGMRSRPEAVDYDRAKVERATGIRMPRLPAAWILVDAQIYPSDDGPSVELSVRDEAGKQFSIIGMKSDTPGGASPVLEKRMHEHIAFWEEGDHAFAVIGTPDGKSIMRHATQLSGEEMR